jgi:hypothetical protein
MAHFGWGTCISIKGDYISMGKRELRKGTFGDYMSGRRSWGSEESTGGL